MIFDALIWNVIVVPVSVVEKTKVWERSAGKLLTCSASFSLNELSSYFCRIEYDRIGHPPVEFGYNQFKVIVV